MFAAPLTVADRIAYGAVNTVAFVVAVIGVNVLSVWSHHVVLATVAAFVAGICLGGLGLVTLDLIETGNPRVRGLAMFTLLAYSLGLWACPIPLVAAGLCLAIIGFLPYVLAESAAQAIRVRACLTSVRHAAVWAQCAQTGIDTVLSLGTGLLLVPVTGPGPAAGPRMWATVAVIVPLVAMRALRRRGQTAPIAVLTVPRAYVCRHASVYGPHPRHRHRR